MSDKGRTKVRARGETVEMWNNAAAGPPSIERVRSSVDEAIAAMEEYGAARRAEAAVTREDNPR